MSDIRIKMAKDLRDMSDMVGDLHWMAAKAVEDLTKKEGEIAKRDARIVELESGQSADMFLTLTGEITQLRAELAAIKAQEPIGWYTEDHLDDKSATTYSWTVAERWVEKGWPVSPLYAAPVSEAKAQGEYGEAYQGAREDLAIWKRRALEAEEKVLQQEQIIDHLTSEAQGESRFGEPVVTPDAPCVPGGYVLADKKALGTVLQALVNAPHHIRELQVTRQPVELFSDNPINVLIANYEAPAAPAAPAADAWIPVGELMPESGRTVLAYYLNRYGKGRTIRAQYIKAWTVQAEDMADPDIECVEYSEQEDAYYLLEGWYECIDNWDEYYRVAVNEGPITHWMPLPAAPKVKP